MSETRYLIDWNWVKDELYLREKIRPRAKGRGELAECADSCLEKAKVLSSSKIISMENRISSIKAGTIELEGSLKLEARSLSSYLKGAQKICIFLATIGDRLEGAASRLMAEGEGLEGYLLDRAGSFAVESLAENFEVVLRESYKKKKKSVSMRFSPCYCDWALEEQSKLDRIIDFSGAGVRLTKSYMMVPKKSISAIVGIGPEGLFAANRISPCSVCDKEDCYYRR